MAALAQFVPGELVGGCCADGFHRFKNLAPAPSGVLVRTSEAVGKLGNVVEDAPPVVGPVGTPPGVQLEGHGLAAQRTQDTGTEECKPAPPDYVGHGLVQLNEVASGASGDQQAAYFSRFFIIQASENLKVTVLFDWCGCSVLTGLGTPAAEPEILQDYGQTYKWLVGSTMTQPCSQSTSVWTCPLTVRGGKGALIVWSDSATNYTPAGSYTSYQQLNGTTSSISHTVPIGILPVLLQ